jgi:hypothetical protein
LLRVVGVVVVSRDLILVFHNARHRDTGIY